MDKPSEKKQALESLERIVASCMVQVQMVADVYGLIFDDPTTAPTGTNRALDSLEYMSRALKIDAESL